MQIGRGVEGCSEAGLRRESAADGVMANICRAFEQWWPLTPPTHTPDNREPSLSILSKGPKREKKNN